MYLILHFRQTHLLESHVSGLMVKKEMTEEGEVFSEIESFSHNHLHLICRILLIFKVVCELNLKSMPFFMLSCLHLSKFDENLELIK